MAKTRKRKRRRIIKTVFNPRGWMGYDNLKASGQEVKGMFKGLTETNAPGRKETFEEAMRRMRLTEEDIAARMKQLLLSSSIYAAFAVGLLIYALVSLFFLHLMTFLVAAVISLLGFALAFRDSFFYFQMKKRKLGCTIREWIAFILRRDRSSSKQIK